MSIPGNNDYNGNNGYNPNPNQNNLNKNNDYNPGYQSADGTTNAGYQHPNGISPAPVAPKKKTGGKIALIAGVSVLTVGLLGGGVFAATNAFNGMSDKDISKAMPANVSMFGEIDLNPSNEQKMGLLSLSTKINDISEDKTVKETKDPKELAAQAFFGDLNYVEDVEPWIGDKAAIGAWGEVDWDDSVSDISYNEDYRDDDPASGVRAPKKEEKLHAVVIYEVKDKTKAEEAIQKTDEEHYTVTKDYLTIASSQKALDAYNSEMTSGTLNENDNFTSDRKTLDTDNVAMGWVDLKKLGIENSDEFAELSEGGIKIDGRVVSSIGLSDGKVSNVTKLIGFESDKFDTTDAPKGLNELKNLPGNTMAAISVSGLDASLKSVWEKNKDDIEESSDYEGIKESLEMYGITLPEDFTKIVGTEFAIGAGTDAVEYNEGDDWTEDAQLTARMANADENFYKDVIKDMDLDPEYDINVKKDGDTVVLNFQGEGEGKLVDNDNFKKAVGDTKNSQIVFYADLEKVASTMVDENKPDTSLGSVGMNGSYDKQENVSTVVTNWIY